MTSHGWHARSAGAAGMLRAPFFLHLVLLAAGAGAAERHTALPAPVDLSIDGKQAAKRGRPVVILFSLPDCPFCDVVRQNYLAPLARDLPEPQRPILREVQITGAAKFSGFDRKQVSHRDLASRYGARFAPTVVLTDGKGNLLTQPVIGGDVAGLYGAYLENALAEASHKMARSQSHKIQGRTQ